MQNSAGTTCASCLGAAGGGLGLGEHVLRLAGEEGEEEEPAAAARGGLVPGRSVGGCTGCEGGS